MMKQKKVFMYTAGSIIGGQEKHIFDIIIHINKTNYLPILGCPSELISLLSKTNRLKNTILFNCNVSAFPPSLKEVFKLYNYLKKNKIDIFHSHGYAASRWTSMIAKLAGVPVIIQTIHIVEHWRRGLKRFYAIFDFVSSYFADKIIAVSKDVKNYYVEQKGVSANKIIIINNGVDLDNYGTSIKKPTLCKLREELGIANDELIISVIGRLEKQKGHRYFIDAISVIKGTMQLKKNKSIKYLIIGEGSLEAELKTQVRELGLKDRIMFIGFRENVIPFYHISDIIVLPSLFEGLPLTVLEAQACGRSVIATDIQGTRDIIVHNKTGILVPAKNPQALASAIVELIDDEVERKKYALFGYESVKKYFCLKTQIEKITGLYEQLSNVP